MNVLASLRLNGNALPPWLERVLKQLPQFIAVLLVVAIAWQLVQLTWLVRGQSRNADALNSTVPISVPPPAQRVNAQAIVNAHLFGAVTAEVVDPANAPPTQAPLTLAGVVALDEPKKGFAVISDSPASQKFYAVGGEALPDGARLFEVYPDRVILDRSGQLETLSLPRQLTLTIPPSRPRRKTATATATPAFADSIRRLVNSPNAITEVLRPQVVMEGGTQRGYRVFPGRNRTQFANLGLQAGDLILAINGMPLNDPSRGNEILNTLGNSDQVSVTLERNGQQQQLTLNTGQIYLTPVAGPPADQSTEQSPPPATVPETQ